MINCDCLIVLFTACSIFDVNRRFLSLSGKLTPLGVNNKQDLILPLGQFDVPIKT